MDVGNKSYETIEDLPLSLPIFPLTAALLLPRGQMPLNIFEPRYLAMIDTALAGDRLIGMVQPAFSSRNQNNHGLCEVGCAGRLISFNETGDGRYLITLAGICRFKVERELETTTAFRQVIPEWDDFLSDLELDHSDQKVDREGLLTTFKSYLDANDMEADWDSIERTETELLVNALSMMSPYGAAEKQALLEAKDLKTRADTLVAITEMSLSEQDSNGNVVLQ